MIDITISPDAILFTPQLVQQRRDGTYLLIDPSSPNWASVNAAGSAVIRSCDGRHTMLEIRDRLSHDLDVHPGDIARFIQQAAEAGLIATAPDVSPAYRGRAQAIAPSRLEELWINLSNSCPLRCKHCLVDAGTDPVAPLGTDENKRLIDEAVALGVSRVYFTGGEPLVRRDLLALVEYVTQRCQLVVMTSGVLVSEDLAHCLSSAANGNLLMQVSLEGPDASTNDAIRGEGSFQRAIGGVKALMNAGLTPVVTTTLTPANYRRAADTTRFLASLGIRDHHILWLHGRGRMRQNMEDMLLPGQEVAAAMEQLRQTVKGASIIVDNLESLAVRARGKRGHKNDLCNSAYGIVNVSADGHVFPCAALSGAAGFDCGSIRENSLREVWLESPVMDRVRENSVQKRVGCSSCFLKFICGGGCFAQSHFSYEMATGEGCIMGPDPYCTAYKTLLTELMWEMATPRQDETTGSGPALYRHMEDTLPGCATGGNTVLDAAFDVGTYHCSCVLAMDTKR